MHNSLHVPVPGLQGAVVIVTGAGSGNELTALRLLELEQAAAS